ncbi:alanine--tRNA ligase [bacterium]|nr:alanine--tRNA ligase [bacterium]MCI0680417.1 alanine--tRNA ligase [bacterium]
MTSDEIRKKFLAFFEKRGHAIIPSASLIPEGDSSVLFTTAGMQQFKPYYIGKKDAMADFGSKNVCSIQKCVRTSDIDEVGDESHLTFFEMLGNFSFGGYFKEEAILFAHEFITKEMGLAIDYVSVFGGDDMVSADNESEEIWKRVDSNIEVRKFGREDNFWGPTGDEGPCGPTTEIYIDGIEIWNIVFNEYYQKKDKTFEKLPTPGVDTGMGLERLAKTIQKVATVFDTDLYSPLIESCDVYIRRAGRERVHGDPALHSKRIIADHMRTSVFLIADGLVPSPDERGYVLRKLIRRAYFHANRIVESPGMLLGQVCKKIVDIYGDDSRRLDGTWEIVNEEIEKFKSSLKRGENQFDKISSNIVSGKKAFDLLQNFGLPLEITKDIASEKNMSVDVAGFEEEFKKHQELSRAGAEKKFRGGLLDHSEMSVKYHTATHLLHQALRDVLGGHVLQKGSNITPERLRFDFSHGAKMTDEEIKKTEELVNAKIAEALPVSYEDIPLDEAKKRGAIGLFEEKYGDKVRVYQIGERDSQFSLEFCGGPHVKNTAELGRFRIVKEEAVSAGVRRIKAILE